jgi:hypothetical protein
MSEILNALRPVMGERSCDAATHNQGRCPWFAEASAPARCVCHPRRKKVPGVRTAKHPLRRRSCVTLPPTTRARCNWERVPRVRTAKHPLRREGRARHAATHNQGKVQLGRVPRCSHRKASAPAKVGRARCHPQPGQGATGEVPRCSHRKASAPARRSRVTLPPTTRARCNWERVPRCSVGNSRAYRLRPEEAMGCPWVIL